MKRILIIWSIAIAIVAAIIFIVEKFFYKKDPTIIAQEYVELLKGFENSSVKISDFYLITNDGTPAGGDSLNILQDCMKVPGRFILFTKDGFTTFGLVNIPSINCEQVSFLPGVDTLILY
jgi:hypothetical protein